MQLSLNTTQGHTEHEIEGELILTDKDLEEIVTFATSEEYDGKGMAWRGKHRLHLEDKMIYVDPKDYYVFSMSDASVLLEWYLKHMGQEKYRHSIAYFWDMFGKLCLVLWFITMVTLFLLGLRG